MKNYNKLKRIWCKLFHFRRWEAICNEISPPHAFLYCDKCKVLREQRDIIITFKEVGMPIRWQFK